MNKKNFLEMDEQELKFLAFTVATNYLQNKNTGKTLTEILLTELKAIQKVCLEKIEQLENTAWEKGE